MLKKKKKEIIYIYRQTGGAEPCQLHWGHTQGHTWFKWMMRANPKFLLKVPQPLWGSRGTGEAGKLCYMEGGI